MEGDILGGQAGVCGCEVKVLQRKEKTTKQGSAVVR